MWKLRHGFHRTAQTSARAPGFPGFRLTPKPASNRLMPASSKKTVMKSDLLRSAGVFVCSVVAGLAYGQHAPRAGLVCSYCHSVHTNMCAEKKCPAGAIGCGGMDAVTPEGMPYAVVICIFPVDPEPVE